MIKTILALLAASHWAVGQQADAIPQAGNTFHILALWEPLVRADIVAVGMVAPHLREGSGVTKILQLSPVR